MVLRYEVSRREHELLVSAIEHLVLAKLLDLRQLERGLEVIRESLESAKLGGTLEARDTRAVFVVVFACLKDHEAPVVAIQQVVSHFNEAKLLGTLGHHYLTVLASREVRAFAACLALQLGLLAQRCKEGVLLR
jgi:hypothetical protein